MRGGNLCRRQQSHRLIDSHRITRVRENGEGDHLLPEENRALMDFAVVAGVASVEDYVTYRDHPAHQAALVDLIRPHIAERAAVQHHLR